MMWAWPCLAFNVCYQSHYDVSGLAHPIYFLVPFFLRDPSYYIIFHFETDWSRIRPLPSTTLIKVHDSAIYNALRTNQSNFACIQKMYIQQYILADSHFSC